MTRTLTPTEIANLIDMIRYGRLNSDGTRTPINLVQMTRNIKNYKGLSEEDGSLLLEEAQMALRQKNTRKANELFGPKDLEAKDTLNRIYKVIAAKYDLSKNVVNNGVKIGGDMIAGRVHVDVYFSYKNIEKWHTTFAWIEEEPTSQAYFKVANYWSGRAHSSLVEEKFALTEEEQVVAIYEDYLKRALEV
jgi:hypothetical protein